MAVFESVRTITAVSAVDLSALAYHFGLFTSAGLITSGGTNLTAQGQVSGIIGEGVAASRSFPLIVPDYSKAKVIAGAAISVNALVGTNAAGRAITHVAAAGNIAWGRALEASAADGNIITIIFGIQAINAGT